jgi:hypothetical protein
MTPEVLHLQKFPNLLLTTALETFCLDKELLSRHVPKVMYALTKCPSVFSDLNQNWNISVGRTPAYKIS